MKNLILLLGIMSICAPLFANEADENPFQEDDDSCADHLLVILRAEEMNAYVGETLKGQQVLQAGDRDALWVHLSQLEEVHATPILIHLAQMFPYVVTQYPQDLDFIWQWVVALQRQELTFHQKFLNTAPADPRSEAEVLGALEGINLLRHGVLDEDMIGNIVESLERADFSIGKETYAEHLEKAYRTLRAEMTFDGEEPVSPNMPAGLRLKNLLIEDLKSLSNKDFAEFFVNLIYVQMELATKEDTEAYTPLGPIMKRARSEEDDPGAQQVKDWLENIGFYFDEESYDEDMADDDEGVEFGEDVDSDEGSGVDYAAIALDGSEPGTAADEEEEILNYEEKPMNAVHQLVGRVFDGYADEDEMPTEEVGRLVQADESPIEDWLRPYPMMIDHQGYGVYLTPLQVMVLTRNREGIAAVEDKLRFEGLPLGFFINPSTGYRLRWSGP